MSKAMMWVCGIMCVFQSWLSMNGVVTVFSDTQIGAGGGKVIAYVTAVFFLLILLRFGMIRNVLTDGMGWPSNVGSIQARLRIGVLSKMTAMWFRT